MKIPEPLIANEPQVEMIPLIDVVFLVLVAFIYASMFMTQTLGLPVDLPGASEAETEMAAVINITITETGEIYLDQQAIPAEQLEAALRSAKSNDPEIRLFVMADRQAQLEPLVKVMNLARKVGIKGLTIATDRTKEAAAVQ